MIAKGVCSVCSLWGSGLVIGTVWGGECGAGDGSILGCVTNQSSNILPTVHTSCYPTPQQIQQVRAISIFPQSPTCQISPPHNTCPNNFRELNFVPLYQGSTRLNTPTPTTTQPKIDPSPAPHSPPHTVPITNPLPHKEHTEHTYTFSDHTTQLHFP